MEIRVETCSNQFKLNVSETAGNMTAVTSTYGSTRRLQFTHELKLVSNMFQEFIIFPKFIRNVKGFFGMKNW